MANTSGAKKQIRKIETRTIVNRNRRQRVRTFIKKVETAISSGDQLSAREALRAAQPEMHRAAGKGVFHLKTMSRKLSRLSARIKAMSASV